MDETKPDTTDNIIAAAKARRDRADPSIYDAFLVTPHIHVDKASLEKQIRDLQRGWRRHLLPSLRLLVRLSLIVILSIKRIMPFDLGSEALLNRLGVWFMGRMISPEALDYILRHFHIETSLINFVARNAGADDVQEVSLRPLRVAELGSVDGRNAIKSHDINIYNLMLDLGYSDQARIKAPLPLDAIDFSPLYIGPIDVEPRRRRLVNFDLDTGIYIMIVFLGLFLTDKEIERAITSLQLDEPLLATLANLTGDDQFRYWAPMKFTHWLGYTSDVVRDLRWHMMVTEYAYHRLLTLAAQQRARAGQGS
ncbi:MAG TPA: hypothetical protein ENJ19_01995 [Gammaproteobacteria bacterium]|nr:hypothetical protein [Gammaproteobacteria bacterium]